MTVRIHHVDCTITSGPSGTDQFEDAERLSERLEKYARKLGFTVMYENVDEGEAHDEPHGPWDR